MEKKQENTADQVGSKKLFTYNPPSGRSSKGIDDSFVRKL
jgi:hypothetical protein